MCFAALRAQPSETHWEWQRRIQDVARAAGKPPINDAAAAPLLALAAQLVADVAKQASSRDVVLTNEFYDHNIQRAGDEDDDAG